MCKEKGLIKMDDFEDCVVGVVERLGQPKILCYDKESVLKKLVVDQGMTKEEAVEWFSFNQLGACVGDVAPFFIELRDRVATIGVSGGVVHVEHEPIGMSVEIIDYDDLEEEQ